MDLFEFVKSNLDILDLVREHTSLKKAGVYWKGRCPFHHEKTGSFTVSPHKGIFYCFGCHANGDAIGFTAKIENCSQIDAAKLLVDKYNLQVPESLATRDQLKQELQSEKQHFKTCEIVTLWCQKNLTKNSLAYKYLVETRQITSDTIDQFKVGYFADGPAAIKSLINFASSQNILLADLVNANILIQTKTNTYSPFEDRIIFPITDYLGRYCGFGGRVFKPLDQRAKYYNSRENPYFNKGALLFGLDKARKSIQQQDSVFLVEGYTDCVALFQHGYPNVVAILGTACTTEHIKLISRFCTQIYVLYDSDQAGQQAILRLTELCWNFNIEVKVIILPEGADPASFLTSGETLETAIAESQDIYKFIVERSCKSFNNEKLANKIQGIEKLINIINNVPDQLKRSILLEDAARSLGLPVESLRVKHSKTNPSYPANATSNLNSGSINGSLNTQATHASLNKISNSVNNTSIDTQVDVIEKKIFAAIINKPELFISQYYPLATQLSAPFNKILDTLINTQVMTPNTTVATQIANFAYNFERILSNLELTEQEFVRQTIMSEGAETGPDEFKHLMLLFLQKRWKIIIGQTKQQITNAQDSLDHSSLAKTVAEFQKLKTTLLGEIK
jgi:DNA primase